MKKTLANQYIIHPIGITLWLLVIFASALPLALAKTDIPSFLIPRIEFIFIFFGSIYLSINALNTFLYGLFIDSIYGYPIGTSSLLLLSVLYLIRKLQFKLINLEAKYIILYFAVSISLALAAQNIILSGYYSSAIIPYYYEIFGNIVVNIVFYAILHMFLYNKIWYKSHEN